MSDINDVNEKEKIHIAVYKDLMNKQSLVNMANEQLK